MRVVRESISGETKNKLDFFEIVGFLQTSTHTDYLFLSIEGEEMGLIIGENTTDHSIYYDFAMEEMTCFEDMDDFANLLTACASVHSLDQFVEIRTTLTYKTLKQEE